VPLLITGDGIPANHAIDAPVELVDLFPTICDWANVPLPPHLDGESLTSLLEGKPQQRRKRFARSELLGEREEVRFRIVRDQRWMYVEFPTASPRLFELQNDPGELHDLAANPPDEVALETLQRELR